MTIRKRASALTAAERKRFVETLTALNSGPAPTVYAQFVADHADMGHRMHSMEGPVGRQRFLSWHRDFLMKFERELQKLDPLVFIPAWRWSANRSVPRFLRAVLPVVAVPATPGMGPMDVTVTREPHLSAGLPTVAQIASLDTNIGMTYTQFTTLLESYHNTVHGWVGGTMNDIMVSPADPLFWLHHAEIDRIWSIWQANPANAGKGPTLTGANAKMDPWPETAHQLASIAALGYSYS